MYLKVSWTGLLIVFDCSALLSGFCHAIPTGFYRTNYAESASQKISWFQLLGSRFLLGFIHRIVEGHKLSISKILWRIRKSWKLFDFWIYCWFYVFLPLSLQKPLYLHTMENLGGKSDNTDKIQNGFALSLVVVLLLF